MLVGEGTEQRTGVGLTIELVPASGGDGCEATIDPARRHRHPVLRLLLPAAGPRRAQASGGPRPRNVGSRARRRNPSPAAEAGRRPPAGRVLARTGNLARDRVGGDGRGRRSRPRCSASSTTRSATTFHASDARIGDMLALTRVGALLALLATSLADRRGRRRSILISVVGSAVACAISAVAADARRSHRRAGAPARHVHHGDHRRGHRGDRGGTRRRTCVLGRRCSRSRAASDSRSRSSHCRWPTSRAGAGDCRSCSARVSIVLAPAHRAASRGNDALYRARGRTDVVRGQRARHPRRGTAGASCCSARPRSSRACSTRRRRS